MPGTYLPKPATRAPALIAYLFRRDGGYALRWHEWGRLPVELSGSDRYALCRQFLAQHPAGVVKFARDVDALTERELEAMR